MIAPITDAMSYDELSMARAYTRIVSADEALSVYRAGIREKNSPNARAAQIAATGVPIALAIGTAEGVVPNDANARALLASYTAAGGTRMRLIEVAGVGHEVTTFAIPELIDFMTKPLASAIAELH